MLKYYDREVYVPLTTDLNCPDCNGTDLECRTDGSEKYKDYLCRDCFFTFTIEWRYD